LNATILTLYIAKEVGEGRAAFQTIANFGYFGKKGKERGKQ
jgi:hypothetical protein